ncbi:ComF family protein [Melghirimyces algeriensis]|uniref:ComF family protein n=1 Tax=Melghirimyces algeriensis TaxID=910412 RepID=A0A521D3T9_9BACL|nr:ComF family protein [Melghirimyces algeriensis]SMO66312.1 comF family protein [Melghirimyces algeriensis]
MKWWEVLFQAKEFCCLCDHPHRNVSWAGVWERICPSCCLRLSPISGPCCPLCGRQMGRVQLCGDCRQHPEGILQCNVAVLRYTFYPKQLIRLLKYRGRERLAVPLAEMMAERFYETGIRVNGVTYVPLHPEKWKERGFNQSERLAHQVAQQLHRPLVSTLDKIFPTPPQSQSSRRERIAALQGSFQVKNAYRIKLTDSWLVVDDVYTTGTTLLECARMLKEAGAKQVFSLTFAR